MKSLPYLVAGLWLAQAATGPALAADIVNGKAIWGTKCEICHGIDGVAVLEGTPSFKKGERLDKADADLAKTIKTGLKAMPAWAEALTENEIGDVLAFLRTLKQ